MKGYLLNLAIPSLSGKWTLPLECTFRISFLQSKLFRKRKRFLFIFSDEDRLRSSSFENIMWTGNVFLTKQYMMIILEHSLRKTSSKHHLRKRWYSKVIKFTETDRWSKSSNKTIIHTNNKLSNSISDGCLDRLEKVRWLH